MRKFRDLPPHAIGETLIITNECENSRDNTSLEIICTGFGMKDHSYSGIVNMEIRLSDNQSEGNELFIAVQNEIDDSTGDYAPFSFEKHELKELIDYLQYCYQKM